MKEKYLTVEAGFWISADLLPVLLSCRDVANTLPEKLAINPSAVRVCLCFREGRVNSGEVH